ncbi:ankyrin repeat-containing protein-like protein [Lasiosphaeria miniovina]|uniref:protein S-acyltransferase n=1 Tax=Lasiosphaeria miniovina TaxID=1954250 RepID=A0AA39ZQM6_9PEZI|nr:ankyrin repeat-containing protein-like protein [Lasiosphaeria miniovina]KAK0701881.1 ankyrin repeat-containing protein-like protein [Lasiosphaeria miniovina]
MDPLSIATGVVAVATVAAQVCNILAEIRRDWDSLPGRIHALNNEMQDFNAVLHQIAIVAEEKRLSAQDGHAAPTLLAQLARGKTALLDLKTILERLLSAGLKKREAIPRVMMWRTEQRRVLSLQEEIKQVKSSMNILLGASNSQDMTQVRLELEKLSLKFSDSTEISCADLKVPNSKFVQMLLEQHHTTMSELMSHKYSQVDQRLERVEALLQTQATQMHAAQSFQAGRLYNTSAPPARRRPVRRVSPSSASRIQAGSDSIRMRLRQARTTCQSTCRCSCHSVLNKKTPASVDGLLGQLFVGFSGWPFLSAKCDSAACTGQRTSSVSLEYWFPLGICWSQIVRFSLAYETNVGPSLQLNTLRRVPDSSQCVSFALEGNIDGLKSLFNRGLASSRDVSSTRGYTLLRWALYGQQYETCKFLMAAGADPTYRPIAKSDDSPSDKAVDIILRGRIPEEVIEILRLVSEGSDFIERQNFARIHKIVLGLCGADLEEELRSHPRSVDCADSTGRTALQWAAARGDERAVITLLSWGADPNNMDEKLNTPLTLAANQNQTACVRLLLEAGAFADPELPPGIKFGTPLNCAARNARDPMLMKSLLDFDAKIEASGVDGVTPLLHVARGNSAAHAMLLLEYGANINATSKNGQTPLTTAIQYNNHHVLRLLLERWFEYTECPRLTGPNLLEIIAQYADVETILLLTAAEHLRVSKDSSYVLDHYNQVLEERIDFSNRLDAAFEDLLSVMRIEAEHHGRSHGIENRMESGLMNPLERYLDCSDEDTDSSSLSFEDAKESLSPTTSERSEPG